MSFVVEPAGRRAIRAISALGIVSLSIPLFGYPLMTDAPEITPSISPTPWCREYDHHDRDDDAQDDPCGIHERRSVPAGASAGTPNHRGMMIGGTRTIMASNSALGRGDVPATMHDSSVSDVALAAMYKRRWREDMQCRPFTTA